MNFLSKKPTAIFILTVVLSAVQVITMTNYSIANPARDSGRDTERDPKIFSLLGNIQTQQIISSLQCPDLMVRADLKSRDVDRWAQITKYSTGEYRRDSLAAGQASLDAMRQYMNEYKKKGC
jgi:hypothetical protein